VSAFVTQSDPGDAELSAKQHSHFLELASCRFLEQPHTQSSGTCLAHIATDAAWS
jgi:hypothetical protein